MCSMALKLVCVLALAAACVAQQYDGNQVDYDDYQDAPARAPQPFRPPARAPQPSQSRASAPRPTPVPILKQINRHNEDGSYTYGYEAADGTFKIETKYSTGDVKGKYGFVDDTGKVRVVEYGADRYGFQPSGEGITVAPPTLVDETTREPQEEEFGFQARPQVRSRPQQQQQQARPRPRPAPVNFQQDSYDVQTSFNQEPQHFAPQPARRPAASRGPAPPRPNIPGAAPVQGGVVYSPQQRPSRPHTTPLELMQHAPRAGPSQHARVFSPEPQQYQPQPAPQPRPAHQPRPVQRTGGLLDQLARDYALPDNAGVALHDISFGYY